MPLMQGPVGSMKYNLEWKEIAGEVLDFRLGQPRAFKNANGTGFVIDFIIESDNAYHGREIPIFVYSEHASAKAQEFHDKNWNRICKAIELERNPDGSFDPDDVTNTTCSAKVDVRDYEGEDQVSLTNFRKSVKKGK